MAAETRHMGPLVTTDGSMSIDELLATLEDGRHVVVRTERLGDEQAMALRYDGEVFYCDTPTRLHKHRSRETMRTCIERLGYASD